MIHKIEPHKYYPEFRNQAPVPSDYVLIFEGNQVYLPKDEAGKLFLPTFEQAHRLLKCRQSMERFLMEVEYLFSIDDTAFYRMNSEESNLVLPLSGNLHPPTVFRSFEPEYLAFAGVTAGQINRFRLERRFCGRCGAPTRPGNTERSCICSECGMIEYPKISPAIITAVIHEDKILLTRYAGGSYRHWALVAGFVEVGETFKGTVRREVMEEVGLQVGEIVYYKSQPWAFSDSAMIGFFAKLEGDDTIALQESELSQAQWFSRDEIPDMPSDISIGQEMILYFKNGGNPFPK